MDLILAKRQVIIVSGTFVSEKNVVIKRIKMRPEYSGMEYFCRCYEIAINCLVDKRDLLYDFDLEWSSVAVKKSA